MIIVVNLRVNAGEHVLIVDVVEETVAAHDHDVVVLQSVFVFVCVIGRRRVRPTLVGVVKTVLLLF